MTCKCSAWLRASACAATILFSLSQTATAQTGADGAQAEDNTEVEEVLVTGSRIRQNPLNAPAPVLTLSADDLSRTGLSSLADALQRLPGTGSALNSRFNSSGNFGFSPDGGGIGAGAAQINLRHLGAKRTLVLVDGIRWISGASATGVPVAVDLNTIPTNIIERVEVLQDGASAIYGSDAIGGVVNVITRKHFEGLQLNAQVGAFINEGDGETYDFSGTWGARSERTSVVLSASYVRQQRVAAKDRPFTRFLFGLSECIPLCSSGTPQGRFVFFVDQNRGGALANITLDNGVVNDGSTLPAFNPAAPGTNDDFNPFDTVDRFNFQEFNLVVTPNERVNIFGQATHELMDNVTLYVRAMYNNRQSTNQAAPEPIFIGPGAGTGGVLDTVSVDITNPFNPFGCTIVSSENPGPDECAFIFAGRRPLEAGPRIFNQNVNTWYIATGLQGELAFADRNFYWDINAVYSENRGDQIKMGGFIASRLAQALGPVDQCVGAPNGCVPFNFFGGQGPDGTGSITQEMLDFVGFIQKDVSGQDLFDLTINISGDLADLPAGPLGVAIGFEYRDQDGFFTPDSIVVAGDSNGVPASPTDGGFNVSEFYGEISIPILEGVPGADLLALSVAGRVTNYNFTGSKGTYKIGARWRPTSDLLLRGTISTGLRAPGIGELFGTLSSFDELVSDPCSADRASSDPDVVAGCAAQGIPGTFVQPNEQIRILTGGNPNLKPEESDNYVVSAVYSPSWAREQDWIANLVLEFNWYKVDVDGAIRARDPNVQVLECTRSIGRGMRDPILCDGIIRSFTGDINRFENQLINFSSLKTSGIEFSLTYVSPETRLGMFRVQWLNSLLTKFDEAFPVTGGVLKLDRKGRAIAGAREQAFPKFRFNAIFDWLYRAWTTSVTVRYVGGVTEPCAVSVVTNLPDLAADLCSGFDGTPFNFITQTGSTNRISRQVYTDLQIVWAPEFLNDGVVLTAGVNNLFDNDPPLCTSCGLNNFNATLHDVPGIFGYFRVSFRH